MRVNRRCWIEYIAVGHEDAAILRAMSPKHSIGAQWDASRLSVSPMRYIATISVSFTHNMWIDSEGVVRACLDDHHHTNDLDSSPLLRVFRCGAGFLCFSRPKIKIKQVPKRGSSFETHPTPLNGWRETNTSSSVKIISYIIRRVCMYLTCRCLLLPRPCSKMYTLETDPTKKKGCYRSLRTGKVSSQKPVLLGSERWDPDDMLLWTVEEVRATDASTSPLHFSSVGQKQHVCMRFYRKYIRGMSPLYSTLCSTNRSRPVPNAQR